MVSNLNEEGALNDNFDWRDKLPERSYTGLIALEIFLFRDKVIRMTRNQTSDNHTVLSK